MTKTRTPRTPELCGALQRAIADSGKTHYQLGKESRVAPEVIGRFCNGERDILLATASKLAEALQLRLVQDAD